MKPEDSVVEVDMFDKLPTPFGLVRAGVAPDHPKIKSVIRVYEKTAAREGFRFFGDVEVGKDVSVDELRERYHCVVFAYGTATDNKLGIPGEDLPGSRSATEFVNWYNAHPDFADREFDLSHERVVVIGNGNVAADVARMLALPREELEEHRHRRPRDRGPRRESGVKEIVVLGRRGPAQAAFTNPEVRELGEMTQADIVIDPAEMELDEVEPRLGRLRGLRPDQPPQRRDLHRVLPARARGQEAADRPALLLLTGRDRGRRQGRARRRRPQRAGRRRRAASRPRDSGERETIECGLVLRSIGYRGEPIEGVPFDEGAA